jgi:flagellar FliL protein
MSAPPKTKSADAAKGAKAADKGAKQRPADADASGEDGAAPAAGAAKRKRLFIIVGAAVAVLVIGGGATAFLMGAFAGGPPEKVVEVSGPPVYYDVPEMRVDLKSDGRRARFITILVTVELPNAETKTYLDAVKPRVMSGFQTFLREQSAEDLVGKAGTDKIHAAFMNVTNSALAPDHRARDILFRSILVQ